MMLLVAATSKMLCPDNAFARPARSVKVVQTTADLHRRMARLSSLTFSRVRPRRLTIDVRDDVRYQTISGFGASMTDSSARLLAELSAAQRQAALRRLFSARGLDLDFLRVPIGASDFTATGKPYSYDDLAPGESDPRLLRFSIRHDRAYILPALRQVRQIHPSLELLANTWSPPGWMKTNGALDDRNAQGYVGTLRSSDYGPFADYLVRFLQAYASAGVRIDAITPTNEPGIPSAHPRPVVRPSYPGMALGIQDQERFISQYLQPALTQAKLSAAVFGLDESWNRVGFAISLMRTVGKSLTGIAWHCYFGDPGAMSELHAISPLSTQIVDECSSEIRPFSETELLISSLRNWANTVADWNLALNPQGGPVQLPNGGCDRCRGIVTVDPGNDGVQYGLKYYQMGQLSAMVQRGARRIASNSFVSYSGGILHVSQGLDDVAFVNPNRTRVLVVYNNSPHRLGFEVQAADRGAFATTIASRATDTFMWH